MTINQYLAGLIQRRKSDIEWLKHSTIPRCIELRRVLGYELTILERVQQHLDTPEMPSDVGRIWRQWVIDRAPTYANHPRENEASNEAVRMAATIKRDKTLARDAQREAA